MTISTGTYAAELAAWRETIEEPLRRDWVSLVGRFELQPGLHRVGANPYSEIRLPEGSAPDYVGVLAFTTGEVRLAPAPGVSIAVNGAPLEDAVTLRFVRSQARGDTSLG